MDICVILLEFRREGKPKHLTSPRLASNLRVLAIELGEHELFAKTVLGEARLPELFGLSMKRLFGSGNRMHSFPALLRGAGSKFVPFFDPPRKMAEPLV